MTKAWNPWDDSNPAKLDWFDDDDLTPMEEPVPAGTDPDEPRLTIAEIVILGAGLVTDFAVRKAIAAGVFPSAHKRKCWTVVRSEVEAWLERVADEAEAE